MRLTNMPAATAPPAAAFWRKRHGPPWLDRVNSWQPRIAQARSRNCGTFHGFGLLSVAASIWYSFMLNRVIESEKYKYSSQLTKRTYGNSSSSPYRGIYSRFMGRFGCGGCGLSLGFGEQRDGIE
jgi:hypothetical protein